MVCQKQKDKCIIFNPVAKGEKSRWFLNRLSQLDCEWDAKKTEKPGQARELAAKAVSEGFKFIVCAGGDGTLNEIVNGVGDVDDGFKRVIIGVIPLGTSNVFAREHNIPQNPDEAMQVIVSGRVKKIDLPYAEFENQGKKERRYFIQLGGAGLDARAVELVRWELKKKIGWLAYIYAGIKAASETQPHINIKYDNGETVGNLVLFGNGHFYGGSFNVFPNAACDDGFLELAIYPKVNYGAAFKCLPGLITKNFADRGGVKYYLTRGFELKSDSRTGFELDGEYVGVLPVKVKLNPLGVQIIAP